MCWRVYVSEKDTERERARERVSVEEEAGINGGRKVVRLLL